MYVRMSNGCYHCDVLVHNAALYDKVRIETFENLKVIFNKRL